jgi:lipoprotein-anchoring transpeptidase ErfK/SrfK
MFLALAAFAAPASAQQIEFLWGGGNEWGGGRQSVSFNTQFKPGEIVVSFGDRRLYHVTAPGRATSYPIAVPREQSRWQGLTSVSMKRENPPWTPTPTMRAENPKLPSFVPGGHPMNPLGVRALYLGSSTYRIHGTDAPWTIGQAVSKGCIRMFNEDVMDLYPKVPVGTRVTVTWQRFSAGPVVADAQEKQRSTGSGGGLFSIFGPSEDEAREERLARARANAEERRARLEQRRQQIKRYTSTNPPQRQAAVE